MSDETPSRAGGSPVAEYKRLLQRVLENRPSGTRQRLATALGTNRSFVSQMTNPAYAMPVPSQHLDTIFDGLPFFAVGAPGVSRCLCLRAPGATRGR